MALTDAERLQMTALALMKYSVHYKTGSGGGVKKVKLTFALTIKPIKVTPIKVLLTEVV